MGNNISLESAKFHYDEAKFKLITKFRFLSTNAKAGKTSIIDSSYFIYACLNYSRALIQNEQIDKANETLKELMNMFPEEIKKQIPLQGGFLLDTDEFGFMLPGIE